MEVKNIVSAILLKKIHEWAPKNCPCLLCKTYLQNTSVCYVDARLFSVTCEIFFSMEMNIYTKNIKAVNWNYNYYGWQDIEM